MDAGVRRHGSGSDVPVIKKTLSRIRRTEL
jgi:hypothetical protein